MRRRLVVGAVLVVGAAVALALGTGNGAGDEASVEARLARCAGADACLRREYAAAVARGDVATTLVALESLARRGELADCHLEAHRLAHAVYRAIRDVERAFLLGGPQCRMGYLHGAVEASGAGATTRPTLPPCSRFRSSAQRSACSHGFGHALMLWTRHDIRASIEACRASAERGLEREPCELGVMMENSLRRAGRRDFVRASAAGCAAVADSERLSRLCFDNIGVVAALSSAHDTTRSLAACRQLRASAPRATCVRGARGEIAEAQGRG